MDSLYIMYARHNLKILQFFLAPAKLRMTVSKYLASVMGVYRLTNVLPNMKVPDDRVNPGSRL